MKVHVICSISLLLWYFRSWINSNAALSFKRKRQFGQRHHALFSWYCNNWWISTTVVTKNRTVANLTPTTIISSILTSPPVIITHHHPLIHLVLGTVTITPWSTVTCWGPLALLPGPPGGGPWAQWPAHSSRVSSGVRGAPSVLQERHRCP